MPLPNQVRQRLEHVVGTADDGRSIGKRLVHDARRLWASLRQLARMNLVGAALDEDALELACYALQLPARQGKGPTGGKFGQTNLRDRCEQAAELLVSLLGTEIDEALLDRATRIVGELPQRKPALDDARLLADAVNLDDFGVTGLILQAMQLALQGQGLDELVAAAEKREQYGYWEARLKDGFHFEPVRHIARQRLEKARLVTKMLSDELPSSQPASGPG